MNCAVHKSQSELPKLHFEGYISNRKHYYINDICAISNDVVLLACGPAGLRALSLSQRPEQSQINADSLAELKWNAYSIAYENATDTLVLVMRRFENRSNDWAWQLVSLRRNGSWWLVVHRVRHGIGPYPLVAACGSRVLLGNETMLNVFDVHQDHSLIVVGVVSLEDTPMRGRQYYSLSCTGSGNETLVAFTNFKSGSLLRLRHAPFALEQVANITFGSLASPLWFREHLLFLTQTRTRTANNTRKVIVRVESLRLWGNELIDRRVLLDIPGAVREGAWTLAGKRLVLWKSTEPRLYVYTF